VGVQVNRKQGTVRISPIFQWFAEDWRRADPDGRPIPNHEGATPELRFIARYLNAEDRAYLLSGDYALGYLDYDWALKRQRGDRAAAGPS
jgi:hypothetical protein